MRSAQNLIWTLALASAVMSSVAYADTTQTDELVFLTRSCISAASGGADIVATIEESEYSDQLQPHHRNKMEQTKVYQATDKSFFLQNDPVAETCIIRSTIGEPEDMRAAVKSMVAKWYGGTTPIYSGPNASDTANRDIYCVDPGDFGNGWYLIATSAKPDSPPSSTTILASAGRVADSCSALMPKFRIPSD